MQRLLKKKELWCEKSPENIGSSMNATRIIKKKIKFCEILYTSFEV